MTADRWQQIKTLFDRALEREAETRLGFVRAECGDDDELRREVESLLAADESGGSRLEHPAIRPEDLTPTLLKPLPVAMLSAGTVLAERYEIQRELGRGGMSVVYLAQDRQLLARRVVIKVLLRETNQDPYIRQKFLQEMEALARIEHPGVVGVLDAGLTPEGHQFLVMQFIEGTTLRHAIRSGGMDHRRTAGILRQIGQALNAAHEKGIWHRDLKPENVMLQNLGGEDHVKLIDFGIAGIQNSQFSGELSKVAGSLSYMAPEQYAGHASAASDTYSLGVVACEMLTGAAPGTQSDLKLLAPVSQLIKRAMSYDPAARPSSPRVFTDALARALIGTEPTRRPTGSGGIEMAHVLFTDLVGYSLLPMDQQKEYLQQLQETVRESPQFQISDSAGDIINLPTGDGMALAFFGDPTAPAQCALEVARVLKTKPHLKLRMGIHTGPVYRVADMNANANVAGGGINMAQRVMDCGDAGHILVSSTVADVLLQLSEWSPHLTDLGECTVKHGVKLHLSSLVSGEVGNKTRPRKLAAGAAKAKLTRPMTLVAAFVLIALIAAGGAFWFGVPSLSGPDRQSVAVLPFTDLSPAKDQQYFSEGVAEELLNALAKIPGLRVAGRNSAFQFAGKMADYRLIGQKLNVATILEGSIGKQGNRTKITTRLIKAADGYQLWSETYNREMTDIFAVQEEIARAVTGALKVALGGGKAKPAVAKSTNPEAYNAYLQGRYFFERRTKANVEKAIGYFQQATKIDPNYALAWAWLAESWSREAVTGGVDPKATYELARQAANRALALDADLAEGHAAMGWVKQFDEWDWAGADASFKRALALSPGNATLISSAGILARTLGRLDEATALGKRAMEIDPLNAGACYQAGLSLYYAGRYAEAQAALGKVLELVPERDIVHLFLGRIHLAQSQPKEALVEMGREKSPAFRPMGLALAYHALGRKKESDTHLMELMEKFGPAAQYFVAAVYAYRGEKDRAFDWLNQAYDARQPAFVNFKGDPLMKSLMGDPRHTELLKKLRLPL